MKKKIVFIILILAVANLTGCGKKQESLEQIQEPLSIETLGNMDTQTQVAPETKPGAVEVAPQVPAVSSKPTVQEIQTSLKNAGYYTGIIDGKIGPLTRKAIEDFQKANGLQADGKVGPKTWSILSTHLNPPVEPPAKKKR